LASPLVQEFSVAMAVDLTRNEVVASGAGEESTISRAQKKKKKMRKRGIPEVSGGDVTTARGAKRRRVPSSGDTPSGKGCEADGTAPGSEASSAGATGGSGQLSAKAARKRRKKLRERSAKARRREEASARNAGSLEQNFAVKDGERHDAAAAPLTKRMKKRMQYKAKLALKAKGSDGNATPAGSSNLGKGKGIGSTVGKSADASDDEYDEAQNSIRRGLSGESDDEPSEEYMGRRARRSAGKGGNSGKGKDKRRKISGPVHRSKAEKRAMQAEKAKENDNKTAGKRSKGKGGKGGKGRRGDKGGKGGGKGKSGGKKKRK